MKLDGTNTSLEIDPVEVDLFYQPLAEYLINKSQAQSRFIIGIAGPPASGKSSFTLLLTAVINGASRQAVAANVGLDGWHYPNAYLDTHTTFRNNQSIPLRQVKGAPETYDVSAVKQFLTSVRLGESPEYPLYNRELHDPIPAAGKLSPANRLVLIEGNYLLLNIPMWSAFRPLFDLTIFLTAPREEMIQALRDRHLRGGKSPEAVENHLVFSDIPNLDLINSQSNPPDILVQKADSRRIIRVIYP